jgi:predicted esterase
MLVRIVIVGILLGHGTAAVADNSITIERTATTVEIFGAQQAHRLAKTLPENYTVRFRIRIPDTAGNHGVLVFIKSGDSGEPPPGWPAIFEQRNLVWIAAEGFGNDKPTAQRVLCALMALELAKRETQVDGTRLYVGGISGGGRVASQLTVRFPDSFAGALYIVGANFWSKDDRPAEDFFKRNRYVFITGDGDFNRREMREVYARYREAGVEQALLLDIKGLGHQFPNAAQLNQALEFLDAR